MSESGKRKKVETEKKIYRWQFIHQCQLMTHSPLASSAACQGTLLEKGLLLGLLTAVRFCLLVLDSCSCCFFLQRGCHYKNSNATAVAVCIGFPEGLW